MSRIGKNIKKARSEKGYTQEQLAQKLSVTRNTISNYETGHSNPDIEMLQMLAEALETDPNTLIYGEKKNQSVDQIWRKEILKRIAWLVIAGLIMLVSSYLIKYGNEIAVVNPVYIEDKEVFETWKKAIEDMEKAYMKMKELGASTDMCREILPHSTAAEYTMTANIREWKHILELRTTNHVHPAIRQVLIPLLLLFKEQMPEIFGDIEYDKEFNPKYYAKLTMEEDL